VDLTPSDFTAEELDILKLLDVEPKQAISLLYGSGYADVPTARMNLGAHLPYHCGILVRIAALEYVDDQRRLAAMGDDL
jgi:hypothetical protein